jgi:hypothetical protein
MRLQYPLGGFTLHFPFEGALTMTYGSIDGYQDDTSEEEHLPRRSARHRWVRVVAVAACVIVAISSQLATQKSLTWPDGKISADAQDFSDETRELFYHDQLVNHHNGKNDTWSNRYYQTSKYWKGPGHPVFLIVGGEDALNGMLYPFISRHLASHFGAAVINIEHRFYGPYQPITGRKATVSELLELLSLEQAMADMIRLTKHYKDELNCNFDRSSEKYCPVITVGGSYPGVLSALLRLVYPGMSFCISLLNYLQIHFSKRCECVLQILLISATLHQHH